jgi:hypothetical protein
MASKELIQIDTLLSAQQFKDICPLNADKYEAMNSLVDYFGALSGGNQMATVTANVGAVQAAARVTFTGAPTNAQAGTLGNLSITAVTSGATGRQFNIGGSVAITATNFATMVNAQYPNVLTAVANSGADGRVDITAVVPGVTGNNIDISIGNLANTTLTSTFADGSNGTTYTLNLT